MNLKMRQNIRTLFRMLNSIQHRAERNFSLSKLPLSSVLYLNDITVQLILSIQ